MENAKNYTGEKGQKSSEVPITHYLFSPQHDWYNVKLQLQIVRAGWRKHESEFVLFQLRNTGADICFETPAMYTQLFLNMGKIAYSKLVACDWVLCIIKQNQCITFSLFLQQEIEKKKKKLWILKSLIFQRMKHISVIDYTVVWNCHVV